jgi:predicted dinucleotide-binding enzyme
MIQRRYLFALPGLALLLRKLALSPANAAVAKLGTIAIIGHGEVGGSFGRMWAARGHKIIYGVRDTNDPTAAAIVHDTGNGATATTQKEAAQQGDIVLLAVPARVIIDVVKSLGDLSGKVLITPANAYNLSMKNGYPYTFGHKSFGEQIQELAPNAKVVTAFNSIRPEILNLPAVPGGAKSKPLSGGKSTALSFGPVSVAICGDDKDAKARVSTLVVDAGLEPADMGPNSVGGFVEGLTALFVAYRTQQNNGKYTETGAGIEWYLRKVPN